jgi:LCP family protein required for cell wall assembly
MNAAHDQTPADQTPADQTPAAQAPGAPPPAAASGRRHHRRGRRRTLAVLAVVLLTVAMTVTAFGFYLNSKLGDIARYDSRLHAGQRAPEPTGAGANAQNILLLGTDKGSGESIEEELADGEWTTGAFRSDTIMIVHIPDHQRRAFLVSIPRDTYVRIPGYGPNKVNAAFSYGGPDLTTQTIERLTGIYIDHVAMVDWAGFKDLTHAIGGVRVHVAETFTDPHNDVTWEAGTHTLEGQEALQYVRTRYGLQNGDFDRIKRQQNFLRAVLAKTISQGTLGNPLRLSALLGAVAEATTVDSGWSTEDMRRLALAMRGLDSQDVEFLTAPVRGVADKEDVGSVVLLERRESRALWRAVRRDDVAGYLHRYGGDRLPESDEVR